MCLEKVMPSQECHFDAGVRLCVDLTPNQRVTMGRKGSKELVLGSCQSSQKGVRLSGYLSGLESTGWRGVRRNFPDQYGGIATRSHTWGRAGPVETAELP